MGHGGVGFGWVGLGCGEQGLGKNRGCCQMPRVWSLGGAQNVGVISQKLPLPKPVRKYYVDQNRSAVLLEKVGLLL